LPWAEVEDVTGPSPGEIERALAEVFSRPEFSVREPSFISRLLNRAMQWFMDRLADFFPRLELSEASARLAWWIVMGVVVAAVLAIAVRLTRQLRREWRARGRGRGRAARVESLALSVPAASWESAAASAAAAGRWRDASLALYQVLLHRLDAAGAVRYDAAKTPGDYRRELRRDQGALGVLDAFLGPFEPIAFGGRSGDAVTFERLRDAAASAGTDG
jgi:hypothetical protein